MTTKYTPGPWNYEAEDNIIYSVQGERIIDISLTPRSMHVGLEARKANGRLAASAPELLEALEKRAQADAAYAQLVLSSVDPDTHERLLQQIEDAEDAAKDAARAAIAKARGAQ